MHEHCRKGRRSIGYQPVGVSAGIDPVRFEGLWDVYRGGHPSQAKDANGELLYKDQCAIKVSVAFHAVGVDMRSYTGAFTVLNQKRAALRAKELGEWLNKVPFCGLPMKAENVAGPDWKSKVARRSGIIFFADYWVRDGGSETHPTGDHIDPWNKATLTPSIESTMRFRLGISSFPHLFTPGNYFSSLDKSKVIPFREIR
jgi:hypothetical protein